MATEEMSEVRLGSGGMARAPLGIDQPIPASAQRSLNFALLLSAVRCTVQYVLLPFVLPWIGVAAAVPPWLTLVLSLLALGSLARNLRYMWKLQHAQRWRYLAIAVVVATALVLFVAMDVRSLFG